MTDISLSLGLIIVACIEWGNAIVVGALGLLFLRRYLERRLFIAAALGIYAFMMSVTLIASGIDDYILAANYPYYPFRVNCFGYLFAMIAHIFLFYFVFTVFIAPKYKKRIDIIYYVSGLAFIVLESRYVILLESPADELLLLALVLFLVVYIVEFIEARNAEKWASEEHAKRGFRQIFLSAVFSIISVVCIVIAEISLELSFLLYVLFSGITWCSASAATYKLYRGFLSAKKE